MAEDKGKKVTRKPKEPSKDMKKAMEGKYTVDCGGIKMRKLVPPKIKS